MTPPWWCSAPQRHPRPRLAASYLDLWSLPARVRDPDLAALDGLLRSDERPTWVVVAPGSMGSGSSTPPRSPRVLADHYAAVDTAGKLTIYRLTDA